VGGRWDEADAIARRGPIDYERFVSLCREADVHPRVHAELERRGRLDLVGPQAAATLTAMRNKVRVDNLLLLARAEQALDCLSAAGVTPVALKGLDLLHRVYAGFDERTLDDVDLLVRRDELRRTLDALRGVGFVLPPEPETTHYVRSSHHLPLHSPGPIPVHFEIHWSLAQEGRYRIDPDGLVDRAVPTEIAGRRALRLEDHDLVTHLLVHHVSHYFNRSLKWLVDLRLIASRPEFRWDRVAERAREWGGTAGCGMALAHLRKLDPDTIPQVAADRLPVTAWRRLLTLPLRSSHPLDLFRQTRRRAVQLYLASVLYERPADLPAWLRHRSRRDNLAGDNPLEDVLLPGADADAPGREEKP